MGLHLKSRVEGGFPVRPAMILGIGAVLLAGVAAFAERSGEEPAEIEQLRRRVEQLEARMNRLERQSRVHIPSPPSPGQEDRPRYIVPPQPPLPDSQVPKDWIPKEFNGQTYYLIPVEQPNAGDSTTTR